MKSKINSFCPVAGCRTAAPHTDDPLVAGLVREFSDSLKLTTYALAAMGELRDSIRRDFEQKLIFSWFSRLRQPEELYIRTLYALFIATEEEFPHVISGVTPNGLSAMYDKVNALIFEGKGALVTTLPGLQSGTFKPIDMLHSGGHVSFGAMLTSISLAHNQEVWTEKGVKHLAHVNVYCQRLDYMRQMFDTGGSRDIVLQAIAQLHRTV